MFFFFSVLKKKPKIPTNIVVAATFDVALATRTTSSGGSGSFSFSDSDRKVRFPNGVHVALEKHDNPVFV